MRICGLATDYDGTLADNGRMPLEAIAALTELRKSGRRLFLVTGRTLEDVLEILPDRAMFDSIVAENGAVLFDPTRQETSILGEPPPPDFLRDLDRRGVVYEAGHVIVATSRHHDEDILGAIRDQGMEWEVIFNKGSTMALPSGVNKASGLQAALERSNLSSHNIAAIGDAENDHSFLRICEVSAAVGNALPAIKKGADFVMRRNNGRGVADFIRRNLLNDLTTSGRVLQRYTIELGGMASGRRLQAPIYDSNVLILGSSGSWKSTLTGVFVERLLAQEYQVCILDPEGDHESLDPLIVVGSTRAGLTVEEIQLALDRASAGIVVNLVALNPADKIRLAPDLLSTLWSARAAAGRPHWLVIDEALHLIPADAGPGKDLLPVSLEGIVFVTIHAGLLDPAALKHVTDLYIVGEEVSAQLREFAEMSGAVIPHALSEQDLQLLEGEAVRFRIRRGQVGRPERFRVDQRRTEHHRHVRKYAQGELGG